MITLPEQQVSWLDFLLITVYLQVNQVWQGTPPHPNSPKKKKGDQGAWRLAHDHAMIVAQFAGMEPSWWLSSRKACFSITTNKALKISISSSPWGMRSRTIRWMDVAKFTAFIRWSSLRINFKVLQALPCKALLILTCIRVDLIDLSGPDTCLCAQTLSKFFGASSSHPLPIALESWGSLVETEAEAGETSASSEEDVTPPAPSLIEGAPHKQGQERLLWCHGVEGSGDENSRKLFRNRISYFGCMIFDSHHFRIWERLGLSHNAGTWNHVFQFQNQCKQAPSNPNKKYNIIAAILATSSKSCSQVDTCFSRSNFYDTTHLCPGTHDAAKLINVWVVQMFMIPHITHLCPGTLDLRLLKARPRNYTMQRHVKFMAKHECHSTIPKKCILENWHVPK